MTFANQKYKFDVRKTKRLFYQSALFFKYINWSNFKDVISKDLRVSVPLFYPQILVSKLICFKNLSHLRDYMANYKWNIKVFSNAMKSQVITFLWKISLIHLKYKSQSMSKKVSGKNGTIRAAIFAFSLICACSKFTSRYGRTWKYVNINF